MNLCPAQESCEEGTVTAEFAVVLPAVVAVLAMLLGVCAVGIAQIQLEESARLGARAAARGESAETVQRLAREVNSDIAVNISEENKSVTVTARKDAPGILGHATEWQLEAHATVPVEVGRSS